MGADRPLVLSIAGFDPSGGAGLLADIKTMEEHKVYGLGVTTAQTLQTELDFFTIRWENVTDILKSVDILLAHYPVRAAKIGIVESMDVLEKIVSRIHEKDKQVKIVIDPVVASSSGFSFRNGKMDEELVHGILRKSHLITPNYDEVTSLASFPDPKAAAQQLAEFCPVLLKGGHNTGEVGVDYLYTSDSVKKIMSGSEKVYSKHGSGCVLSAAIASNFALGFDLAVACIQAKKYTEQFLASNTTLLGYHHV